MVPYWEMKLKMARLSIDSSVTLVLSWTARLSYLVFGDRGMAQHRAVCQVNRFLYKITANFFKALAILAQSVKSSCTSFESLKALNVYFAVHLYNNRWQMTSKCSKKNRGTRSATECVTDVLSTSFCDLLLHRPTAKWNLSRFHILIISASNRS